MKYKVGDVLYLKQGEFEGGATDPEYIFSSDAIVIVTRIDANYYICDVYLCKKKRWDKGQFFLDTAYDNDFLPLSDPTFFKEVIETTFEGWL